MCIKIVILYCSSDDIGIFLQQHICSNNSERGIQFYQVLFLISA